MQAKTYLGGTIDSDVKSTAGGCQFSLRTRSGKFFIKAAGLEQIRVLETLPPDASIYVIGLLHSFVSKRCRSHHVYIEALVILPLEDSPVFRQLVSLLNAQITTL